MTIIICVVIHAESLPLPKRSSVIGTLFYFLYLQIPPFLVLNDIKFNIDDVLMDSSVLLDNDGRDLQSVAGFLMNTPAKRVDRWVKERTRRQVEKA